MDEDHRTCLRPSRVGALGAQTGKGFAGVSGVEKNSLLARRQRNGGLPLRAGNTVARTNEPVVYPHVLRMHHGCLTQQRCGLRRQLQNPGARLVSRTTDRHTLNLPRRTQRGRAQQPTRQCSAGTYGHQHTGGKQTQCAALR